MSEYEEHKALWRQFKLRRSAGTFAFHIPNSGRRTFAEMTRLRETGFRAGLPDLWFVRAGKSFGLEYKTLKGRATSDQLQVIDEMKAAGCEAEITYGLENALGTLQTWGLIREGVKV